MRETSTGGKEGQRWFGGGAVHVGKWGNVIGIPGRFSRLKRRVLTQGARLKDYYETLLLGG